MAPGLPEPRHAIARVALGLRAAAALRRLAVGIARVGPEIAVEIFFRGQIGAPGREPARAIVERAHDACARRVAARLEPVVACRRTVDADDSRKRADAAV